VRSLSDALPPRMALGSNLGQVLLDTIAVGGASAAADAALGTSQGRSENATPIDVNLSTSLNPNLIFDWMMTVDISKEWSNWMREAAIIPILRKYTWSTVGTFYRTSGITTLWDYTFADPEWGLSQANFMILELEAAIANANLNVVVKHNKNTVQLLPKSVDKGSAVRRVLSLLEQIQPGWQGQPPDFCLCLGDDTSDELMFGAVHQYFTSTSFSSHPTLPSSSGSLSSSSASSVKSKKTQMFTATVGRKPTTASYYLRDTDAVYRLLSEIVDASVV